ncbi:MAG: hypothetical protein J2P54_25290 [Bradyrhizobiaceae bacterium]|nr:hypothetical protein [Bradyrhizobiaceae bacterium]
MAKAIADTISANTIKSTQGPIVFQSATAHDNFVEIQYAAKDALFFARNKANFDSTRLALTRYYCSSSRVRFINDGVVVHQVMLAPDKSDRIEITVDRTSCANLPVQKLADPESLARMAQAVASRENAEKSASMTRGPFQFDAASADNSVVELHSVVMDESVAQNVKTKPEQLVGLLKGYFCGKYGDELGQGLSIHEKFTLANGIPVTDFTIDRSSCGL